ncbi:MAG: CARDB domain-containing protein [Chloroflexota bacterium]
MNADSTNLTQLTNNSAWDWQPQWGPDGAKIAFSTNRDGNWEVYVMDASGANQAPLSNNPANDWLRGKWASPSVITIGANGITDGSAVLSGNLTGLGTAGKVKVSFQWGLTSNYTGSLQAPSMNATGAFSANLAGLSGNTTYHFRARAEGDGSSFGGDNTFTTTGTSQASPVEVIRNGDFSAGLDNWIINPKLPPDWNPLSGGEVNLHPFAISGFTGVILYQNLNVPDIGGKTLNLSMKLTKLSSPPGSTVAVYVTYVDTANNTQTVKMLNPDNAGIGTNTVLSANYTFPGNARKLVKLSLVKENFGEFVADDISLTSFGIAAGPTPVVSGITGVGSYGSSATISGANFGAVAGKVTLRGSPEGVTVTSWTDTSITVTLAEPASSGRVRVIADFVESNIDRFFDITSPNFTVDILNDQLTLIKGQIAIAPIRINFRNGFTTAGGISFELLSGNSSVPAVFTPVPIRTGGGLALKINTSNWSPGTYQLTVRTSEASSLPRTANFTLKVVTTSSIGFYEFDASYNKVNLTAPKAVSKQGSLLIYAEGTDSDGNPLMAPLILQSDNPSILGVYPNSFMGYYIYSLQTGSARLIASAPDGFTANLTVNITVPADPAITSISLTPPQVTNKYSDNLTFWATGTRAIGWTIIGMLSDRLTSSTMDWSNNSTTFGGNFKLNPSNPPDIGTYLFGAVIYAADQSTRLAEAAVPLTIVNDPSFSAVRGGVFTLDPTLPPFAIEMFNLEFYQGGSLVFSRNVFMHAQGGPPIFELGSIPPGTYKIKYVPFSGSPGMPSAKPQWYPNAGNITGASDVIFNAGQVTPNIYFFPVAAPTLTSIAVLPANPSIPPGQSLQFTALGNYSDNTTVNVTSTAYWNSNNTAVATVNATSGLATAVAPGVATISAMQGLASGSTTLTVTTSNVSKPDLIISEKHEEWVVPGISYRVFYTVKNIGTANALAGHDAWFTVDGAFIEQKEVPVILPPGASYSGNFTAVLTLSGSLDSIAIAADYNKEIDELDEGNNARSNAFAWPEAPDLVVSKHEEWLLQGSLYQVHFTVRNYGNAPAPAGHDVTLTIDGVLKETRQIPVSLAPGQDYVDVFNFTANLTGNMDKVKVTTDVNNEVAESVETNNINENTFAWPPAPDLWISNKFEQWVAGQSGNYTVTVGIRNIGNAVALAGHHVQLKVDGTEIEMMPIPVDLNYGGVYRVTFATVIAMSGNSDNISVTADMHNDVAESDELNNSRWNIWSAPTTTSAPDLIISEKHEEWIVPGSTYRVFYTVQNIGNVTAPAGHDVWFTVDGKFIEQKEVPVVLPPGASYSGNSTTVLTLSGSWDGISIAADYNKEVDELDESNNARSNTFAWPEAPQLGTPYISEEWVVPGSQYKVHFTVRNNGNGAAPAGHDAALIIDGIQVETKPIPVGLAPGEEYTDVFNTTANLTGGVDKVSISTDINNEVVEANEAKTAAEYIISWPPAPDLRSFSLSEQWVAGQSGNYTVTFFVSNRGNAPAPAGFDVQLRVDGTPIETLTVPAAINSLGSIRFTFASVVTLSGNSDNVSVTADINNEVAEGDETNNSAWNILSAAKPDLTIIEKHENWVVPGTSYTISYTVKNQGTATAPAGHNMALQVDGIYIEQKPVPVSLASGANYTDTFNTVVTLSGTTDGITVVTDFNKDVDESSETNNRASFNVAWPAAPDLRVNNSTDEWVAPGSQYKVHFGIRNDGNAAASANHSAALNIDGVEVERKQIPVSLLPGQSYSDVFNATVNITGGMDKVMVTADISNVIAESGETNNTWTNTFAWPQAPDLIVNTNTENWLPGSTTQYNVYYGVQNIGNAPAPAGHNVQLNVDGNVIETEPIPVILNPGSWYAGVFRAELTLSGGSDNITITADINNEVVESDETNNFRTNIWSGVWQTVRSSTDILSDITFVDASNGWAVGSSGIIQRTSDGGATWTPQNSRTTNDLWSVSFVDANSGWAVGSSGTIRRTSDGGNTWTAQTSGVSNTIYEVSFVDANNGWAVGTGGTILHTSNSGANWTSQTSNTTYSLYSVKFVDASNGWAVGSSGIILRTFNGGVNWINQTSNTTDSLLETDFVDISNGWAVGYSGIILRTADGGTTWTAQNSHTTAFLAAVDFADSNNGWVVGSNGKVLHTTDGGTTWSAQTSNTSMNLMGVASLNASQAWVVGEAMSRLYTNNGGATWTVQNQAASRSYNVRSVDFVTPLEGWAGVVRPWAKDWLASTNVMLRTLDGGATWIEQSLGMTVGQVGIDFINTSNGWAVGYSGRISYTSNGGANWTSQTSGTTNNLRGVSFIDTSNGWAVGDSGIILRTSDGGTTWINQTSNTTSTLYSVSFIDVSNGWVVGSSGTILHTSNGGSAWTSQTSNTTNSLNGVSFVDANNGWVVGRSATIRHTSDGGNTWINQTSGVSNSLYAVSFVDASNGWAVGSYGTLRYTSDGGSTWIGQTSGTANHLRAITATDSGHAWAVGDYGIIIRYQAAAPPPPPPSGVEVRINAPARVAPDRDFTVNVRISQVQNFDAANFDVSFNHSVLRLDSVTNGYIGNITLPIDGWNQREPWRFSIVSNIPGLSGADGAGSLAALHFHVIGSFGQSSNITLSNGVLSNNQAQAIPATWIGGTVEVGNVRGDANGDGDVNALDITYTERIIVHLEQPTAGADANLDGNVNALDITTIERIIVGLD